MSTINATNATKAGAAAAAGTKHAAAVAGPKHGLEKKSGDILTERYTISVDKGRATIIDRRTNTRIKVGGDMNISTSDGDKVRIENGNSTIDLKDGTRVTFVPTTDGKGIEKVVITKDREGVVYSNVDTDPKASAIRRNADRLDAKTEDGTILVAGHQVNDLFQDGVGQLKGQVTISGASAAPTPPSSTTEPTTPTAPTPEPGGSTPPPAATPTDPKDGSGGAGTTGGTDAAPGVGTVKDPEPSRIAIEGKKILDKLTPNGIDEAFDWAFAQMAAGLKPEDQAALQLFVTQLQGFTELLSNLNKTKGELQRAIIRNTGG